MTEETKTTQSSEQEAGETRIEKILEEQLSVLVDVETMLGNLLKQAKRTNELLAEIVDRR